MAYSNIISVNLANIKSIDVSGIYQYDYGILLKLEGLDSLVAPQIHFATSGMNEAINDVSMTDGKAFTVNVPREILAQSKPVSVYVYVETPNSGMTVKEIHFTPIERTKPSTLTYEPKGSQAYNALMNEIRSNLKFQIKPGTMDLYFNI